MKNITTTILLVFSISFNLFSITEQDSLHEKIISEKTLQEKALLYNSLSNSFKSQNIDSAIYYAYKGYDISKNINFKSGLAENLASLGDLYIMKDSLDLAKDFYMRSVVLFKEMDSIFDYAQIYMVIGNIFLTQSNYPEALYYYQQSQIESEQNNFKTILPHIYNNKGVIYTELEDNEKAKTNFSKAYKLFEELDYRVNLAHTLSNLAKLYLYDTMVNIGLEYYDEAYKIFINENQYIDASIVLIDLGDYEYDLGNYRKALENLMRAKKLIIENTEDYLGPKSRMETIVYGKIGKTYSSLEEYDKAIEYLNTSLDLARSNNYANWIENNAFELSKIYEKKNLLSKALEFYKIYESYGDSILSENNIKRITQLEMQYGFDKKMQEIRLEEAKKEAIQKQKEYIYIISIIIIISIVLILILLFFNQRNKTQKVEYKRQNLKLEHDKLQQELEHKNKEIATNVMYLLKKNEFITNVAEKLKANNLNFKRENQKLIDEIIHDLVMNSSKDIWKEFEVRFQEVHSDFYKNLNDAYPNLTPNEKKICAFLRLNMSTKDISAITFQSVSSLNMARFRLRKKMGLETDENLIAILSKF